MVLFIPKLLFTWAYDESILSVTQKSCIFLIWFQAEKDVSIFLLWKTQLHQPDSILFFFF